MYWSGLNGAFLLDDTPNLIVIDQLPANPGLSDILQLATTGFAGILGRSISIFTFLLQHESWPDPRNFKLVNLFIHLLNGGLLALCCVLIGRQWRSQEIPLLSIAVLSFVWLAHPIQVSTVLYVVQRMTLLSATFSLFAFIFYLLGRQLVAEGRNRPGSILLFLGLVVFALLAVMSKENGVLIYLYVIVLEYTLFAENNQSKFLHRFSRGLLVCTLLGASVGLALILPGAIQDYELKPFSFSERVLTQFPVLITYIASIGILQPSSYGIFHDDFANAEGLALILSMLLVGGSICAALLRRRQWPLFSFAVLWFFAGHALESTFLPLEYYFEHRNYLPMFGPILAVVVFVSDKLPRLDGDRRIAAIVVSSLAVAFMAIITVRHTALWGDPLDQAYAAVEAHPYSPRAESNLVEKLSAAGQFQAAFNYHMTTLDPAILSLPPYIRWLEFSCIIPGVETPEIDELRRQARGAPHDYGAIFSLNSLVFAIQEGRCPGAEIEKVQSLLTELARNPNYAVSEADIVFYEALLQSATENFSNAARLAADSFALRADVRVGLYSVNWLMRANQLSEAADTLSSLESNYENEIAASADLNARRQFLRDRLETVAN